MKLRNLVGDLKTFLKVTRNYKGHSKDNKETLTHNVERVWKQIISEAMFPNTDIGDHELLENLPVTEPIKVLPEPETRLVTKEHFRKWTVSDLQQYLADRCINKSGNKEKLVDNVYGAYMQKLLIKFTDTQQELEQIKKDTKANFTLENGMVTLPNPLSLKDDWYVAPANLPNTTYSYVDKYLKDNNAGKAFKGGKSLLLSGHLKDTAQPQCALLFCTRVLSS